MLDSVIGTKFVWVPTGCFQMGSPTSEKKHISDEEPVHEVCVDGFWMDRYEVTQAQWHKVMGTNPSDFKGEHNPVENVSWKDVQEFLRKLNTQAGQDMYRLPSEAEWEYAARAGTQTVYSFGDNPEKLGEYAWYEDNSGRKTHLVGQLKPNAWGLHDMHGNVSEWCEDIYSNKAYTQHQHHNLLYHGSGSTRVIRGGEWLSGAGGCRSAYRYGWQSIARGNIVGFRLVRTF